MKFRPSAEVRNYDLLAEQAAVQVDKDQLRSLDGRLSYDDALFADHTLATPRESAVSDFLNSLSENPGTLAGLVLGMHRAKGEPVAWADMGAGYAMPMRQLAVRHPGICTAAAVDLFSYKMSGLTHDWIDSFEQQDPGATKPAAAPTILLGNSETISLEAPADLITSIESIQYLYDPLRALANWYNQLRDDGVMAVSASHSWSADIGYSNRGYTFIGPTIELVEQLEAYDIPFAAMDGYDTVAGRKELDPFHFRQLVIQKKPGTELQVNGQSSARTNDISYKITRYEEPSDRPTIEVVMV